MSHPKPNAHTVTLLAVAGSLGLTLFLAGAAVQGAGTPDLAQADELYRSGQFDEAAPLYADAAKKQLDSYGAALGLGRIFVLRNRLDEAETWVKKALSLKPGEREPQSLMGEILYRRNEYSQAAPYFEAIGQNARAEKLRAFQDKTPFLIESGPDVSVLPFLQTDPLPVIEVTVNGQKGKFLIDTGGGEPHLMPAFAERCGIKPVTQKAMGTFAGGRQAAMQGGIAETVRLGDFSLRNVPVDLPEEAHMPSVFQVDGVIGTVLLYHFRFTLDYPGGRLILRRLSPEMSAKAPFAPEPSGGTEVLIWLAGDHYIFARGTANGAGPYLFLIDTGMAGGGFDCPKSVIDEAKIEVSKEGFQGMGGGGPLTIYPFTVNLTLGEARHDNVRGLYGGLSPDSEYGFGFRTGGLISHGFFRPFAVTFDFQDMKLYLKQA